MGDTTFRRAILAAALGLGVWAGLARAQTSPAPVQLSAPTPAQGPQTPPQSIVVNGVTYTLASSPAGPAAAPGCATCSAAAPATGGAPPNPPASSDKWWANHPHSGCWANFNGFSCSSWESEAAFMFGSCRNFFGEPCAKGPPPPAYPGEYIPRNLLPNCKCAHP